MISFLIWCAFVLGVAGALSVCVLAVRRALLARFERRRLEAEIALRPVALSLLEGEDVDVEELDDREVLVLADLVGRFGRLVRGVDTERIASFFERQGWVERQLRAAHSVRAWRRATAAFALGDMGSRRAIPTLLALMDDNTREVRAAAARSLGRLGATEAVEPLVYGFAERRLPRSIDGQALLAIGPAALERLRPLAGAAEPEARAFAVELVGLLGDASDDRLLVERLRDTSAEVRARAARALGRLGAEEATAELTRALDDRIAFVRAAAATALAAVGDRRAVPRLLVLAQQDQFDAAHAAARAAATIAPDAVSEAARRPGAAAHLLEAADLISARA